MDGVLFWNYLWMVFCSEIICGRSSVYRILVKGVIFGKYLWKVLYFLKTIWIIFGMWITWWKSSIQDIFSRSLKIVVWRYSILKWSVDFIVEYMWKTFCWMWKVFNLCNRSWNCKKSSCGFIFCLQITFARPSTFYPFEEHLWIESRTYSVFLCEVSKLVKSILVIKDLWIIFRLWITCGKSSLYQVSFEILLSSEDLCTVFCLRITCGRSSIY